MLDLQLFKREDASGQKEYCLYLISSNGVLVYYSIEKKEECKAVIDEQNLQLSANCADCNPQGVLIVDAA